MVRRGRPLDECSNNGSGIQPIFLFRIAILRDVTYRVTYRRAVTAGAGGGLRRPHRAGASTDVRARATAWISHNPGAFYNFSLKLARPLHVIPADTAKTCSTFPT